MRVAGYPLGKAKMIITSWNVNGLRAIAGKTLFPWFRSYQPDILCLQETKIQKEQLVPELLLLEGYESYFSFAGKKGYSGTALYTKHHPFTVKTDGFPAELEGEGRIVEAHFQDFILFNVYFPNGQMSEERLQYKLRFYDKFLAYISSFQQKGHHLIITGDFNTAHRPIDLAEPEKHKKTSGFLECERDKIDEYLQHDLIDIFRVRYPGLPAYTYWSYFANARVRNLGWRIDYFLISPALTSLVEDTPIHHDIMGSDHCPVSMVLR